MSSTRKAKEGSPLRQERFASSKLYGKALLGNLVAKRAGKIRTRAARELIYFLADVSLRFAGARHATCNLFPSWPWEASVPNEEMAFDRLSRELAEMFPQVGERNARNLPRLLVQLCLDPRTTPEKLALPDCPNLFELLLEYKAKFEAAAGFRAAPTATMQAITEVLDYALSQRGLVLALGSYRTGKSFSCQAWAQMHLGQCRYVQLSSAKDDNSFYRDIARAFGVASSLQLKAREMRAKIEAVCQEQHLLLIIDEADWIWPQAVRPTEAPARVAWILTSLVNNGMGVALVGSRNFIRMMSNVQKKCPVYGLEQFTGRIRLRRDLPDHLDKDDLFRIAAAVLPESDRPGHLLLVGHALKSEVPVAALESAAARAKYFAEAAARTVQFSDIERAMRESGTLTDSQPFTANSLQTDSQRSPKIKNVTATRTPRQPSAIPSLLPRV